MSFWVSEQYKAHTLVLISSMPLGTVSKENHTISLSFWQSGHI